LGQTKAELKDWMEGKPMVPKGKIEECFKKLENLIKYHAKRPNHEEFKEANVKRLNNLKKINSKEDIRGYR
jgi:hypothetical protein